MAGTESELANAQWVQETWREQGLDEVHMTPFQVLLSYPDSQNPNYVSAKIQLLNNGKYT